MIPRRVDEPAESDILGWLSVAELKQHMRLFNTSQDDVVKASILAAYSFLDGPRGKLQRSILGPQSWELCLDAFPEDGVIHLAYPPVISIEEVRIVDADGNTLRTVSASTYSFDRSEVRPKIAPRARWPEISAGTESIVVAYEAGWPASKIPSRIKHGMKLLAAHYFENREATFLDGRTTDIPHEIPFGLSSLISLDRVPNRYA